MFNDGKKRLVARSNLERADRAAKRRKYVDAVNEVASILVDLSISSVDLGEVVSDNEEVTLTTTENLPSSGDVITTLNAEVVLLKARVKSLERLLLEKTMGHACETFVKRVSMAIVSPALMWVCCHFFTTFGVFPYCAFGKVMSLTAAACTSCFGGTCHCCSVPVLVLLLTLGALGLQA